jgi:hypothetical protein
MLLAAGITFSSLILPAAAQAGTLTYDFLPYAGPNTFSESERVLQYQNFGFADGWGTTYGEQPLFFVPDDDQPYISTTGNPYEIRITAREGTGPMGDGQIRYNRFGLGVKSDSQPDADESAGVVDGKQPGNESLILQLPKTVRLLNATFYRSDSDDQFFLQVKEDGQLVWQQNQLKTPSNGVPFDFMVETNATSTDLTGNLFRFWATTESSNWTLAGIQVEAVPEPTMLLGLLALGTVGGVTLRRRHA